MWEIWANKMFPKGLKSCPMSNKLPNLVTLVRIKARVFREKASGKFWIGKSKCGCRKQIIEYRGTLLCVLAMVMV